MVVEGDRARWLHGKQGCCERTDAPPERPLHMVLLGAPGVGKGTQAEHLSKKYKCCQLSTGDVFRAAKSASSDAMTETMREAVERMKQGKLVSDETVVQIVRERYDCLTCGYGFLLDGFPRTVDQAKALEDMLAELGVSLDAVLNYTLDTDEVIRRLSGRRTCRACKATAHVIFNPPQVEGMCDKCGGELYQRDDDQPDAIRVRLKAYEDSTAPLADYYDRKGLLINISAEGSPDTVFGRTETLVDKRFF
ncbi:MAG TPA: adenylate kinase [Candidatus Hydrogenedentes bacterium]|nr:adenylate kinase [Candidatus Hydrogenedentota bacterium]